MRVLLTPSASAESDAAGVVAMGTIAAALAGSESEVVTLSGLTWASFCRPLTGAEVYSIRAALLGADPDRLPESDEAQPAVVGYVCWGKGLAVGSTAGAEARVIAVADHVNLAWRSPLIGPNDDHLGPRFPVTAGMYDPEVVVRRLRGTVDLSLKRGIVGGVRDTSSMLEFEAQMAQSQQMDAVSSQLLPVALLAAHLGIHLAAAVVVGGED
ncbi:MAG: hypothetical protein M1274_00205 [Actinobacteria bacterium]|nr:hypothetical protein [Actinomycetota bacterium]